MTILVVESDSNLRQLWVGHLVRQGLHVAHAGDDVDAINYLSDHDTEVILLSLELEDGTAMAVADYASYRRPNARIMFVTRNGFFSDGTIFRQCYNTCAILAQNTDPGDLAAMAQHYATH